MINLKAITFIKGDEVICVHTHGSKYLKPDTKYIVEDSIIEHWGNETEEFVYIRINVGNSYLLRYNAQRFDLSIEQKKIRERETKIDSIL